MENGKGEFLKGMKPIRQAAANFSEDTIQIWARERDFPAYRPDGSSIWCGWSNEIREWMEWYYSVESGKMSFAVWREKKTSISTSEPPTPAKKPIKRVRKQAIKKK